MAFSGNYHFLKSVKPQPKKDPSKIKRYDSADIRVWSNDTTQRSIALHDTLIHTETDQIIENDDSSEIHKLMEEIKQKDYELGKIHEMYKSAMEKLKEMESLNKDNKKSHPHSNDSKQIHLNDTTDEERITVIEDDKKRAEKFEDVLKERDELKEQLNSVANMQDLLIKLKMRAEEADEMEQEINKLKSDIQRCGHGGSGDKLKIEPTRVNSDSQCNQCQEFIVELKRSKSMLELRDSQCTELEAERNFLLQRAELIRCMEAELILYKIKYEECECKLLNLKEIVVKAELNERKLREFENHLKTIECQLQESEQQNENLICKIEQLDMDLRERDSYIECLNQRVCENNCNSSSKRAINCEEFIPGKVQAIVQKISKESSKISTCKCNIENCHCGVVSKSLCTDSKESSVSGCHENLITKISYVSNDSSECIHQDTNLISHSETERLKYEISCEEIRILRQQNEELDSEVRRLKDQLCCMSKILEEVEKQRSSNCTMESEINEMKCRHSQELEEVNSTYRSSICQKLGEIQTMEQKLAHQFEQTCELENKLSKMCEELNGMKKYKDQCNELKKSLNSLEACHKERLKEMESLSCKCRKYEEENKKMLQKIDELTKSIEGLKIIKNKEMREKSVSCEQRNMIKNSVIELKKYADEKAYMIKCYEKKIRCLEAENESLKCFRDKYLFCKDTTDKDTVNFSCDDILIKKLSSFGIHSLDYDELTELHDRIRCALMKVTRKVSHTGLDVNYSKIINELCKKYNISGSKEVLLDNVPVRDHRDIDNCSTFTFPNIRRSKRRTIQRNRSKSSEMTKSVCK